MAWSLGVFSLSFPLEDESMSSSCALERYCVVASFLGHCRCFANQTPVHLFTPASSRRRCSSGFESLFSSWGVCSLRSPTSLTAERLDNINADMSRLAAFEYRHRQVIGGVHSCWESATLKRQPASGISLSASRHLARSLSCRNFMFKSSRMPKGERTARTPNADVSP